jgi:hypothetical protein
VAITQVSTAVPAGNPTTSFTITVPTVTTGDLLIVACTNRDATTTPSMVDNDSGTWLRKTSGASKGGLWYRYATAATSGKTITAGGTTAFTGSTSGVLVVLRGTVTAGDPFDQYTLEDNISGNETHASITPAYNGCWIGLAVHNVGNDNAVTNSATTSPGTLTEGTEKQSTGGSDCATSLRGLVHATAGATGAATWTQTDGVTVSQLFAVKPPDTNAVTAAAPSFSGRTVTIGEAVPVSAAAPAFTGGTVTIADGDQVTVSAAALAFTGGTVTIGDLTAATNDLIDVNCATITMRGRYVSITGDNDPFTGHRGGGRTR